MRNKYTVRHRAYLGVSLKTNTMTLRLMYMVSLSKVSSWIFGITTVLLPMHLIMAMNPFILFLVPFQDIVCVRYYLLPTSLVTQQSPFHKLNLYLLSSGIYV